jgi:hypothetical protein
MDPFTRVIHSTNKRIPNLKSNTNSLKFTENGCFSSQYLAHQIRKAKESVSLRILDVHALFRAKHVKQRSNKLRTSHE